jgi:hypothetical protein
MTRAAVWGLLVLLVRTAEGVQDAVQAQFTCKGCAARLRQRLAQPEHRASASRARRGHPNGQWP